MNETQDLFIKNEKISPSIFLRLPTTYIFKKSFCYYWSPRSIFLAEDHPAPSDNRGNGI